jgi:hypothetical protein
MAARETSRPHPPLLTGHAVDRWTDRRVYDGAVDLDLWTAWVDALPIELPEPYCHAGDEARYHVDAQVILCRQEASIATVYDVVGEDADERVQAAVQDQLGIDIAECDS